MTGLRNRMYLEASYEGNMGFEEMVKFYREASKQEVSKMEKYLKNGKIDAAWSLLKTVTGSDLKPMGSRRPR